MRHKPHVAVTSKIRVPPAAGNTVVRERLAIRWHELTAAIAWICAPAGAGKTTLARQWVMTWPGKCAWYSVDAHENRQEAFAKYLIAAIAEVVPKVRTLAASVVNEGAVSLEPLLSELLLTLDSSAPFLLVIDDYHVVTDVAIHAGMRFFLNRMPAHIKVIITSRSHADIGLARLRARGRLVTIDVNDLNFTLPEAQAFLQTRLPFSPTSKDCEQATVATEGWVAGLQMVALAAAHRGTFSADKHEHNHSSRHLYAFFAEEIFEQQSSNIQSFLLATALVDCFDVAIAALLTGYDEITAAACLEEIRKANLFLVSLDDKTQFYRYHHLFAEFLQQRWNHLPQHKLRGVHERACDAWLQRKRLDEATRHALLAQDTERVTSILETQGWALLLNEKKLIAACFACVPRERIVQSWELTYLRGWTYFDFGQRFDIEPLLREAENVVPLNATGAAAFACLRAQLAEIEDDVETAWLHVNFAKSHLPIHHPCFVFVAMLSGALCFREGRLAEAADYYRQAIKFAPGIPHIPALIWSYSRLGNILLLGGSLREAQTAWLAAMASATDAHLLGEFNMLYIYVGLIEVSRELLDLDTAEQYLEKAQVLAEQLGPHRVLLVALTRVRVAIAQWNIDALPHHLHILEQLLASVDVHHHERLMADEARIASWIVAGNTSSLQHWLATCGPCVVTLDPITQLKARAHARAWLASGYPELSCNLITQAIDIARTQAYWLELAPNLVVLSACYCALNQSAAAADALAEALQLGMQTGALGCFLGLRTEIEVLFAADWARSIVANDLFASRLLELIRQRPRRMRKTGDTLPALVRAIPLTASEWAIMQHVADGLSNEKISSELFVELSTVKSHIKRAYRKMGVQSRAQALQKIQTLREKIGSV